MWAPGQDPEAAKSGLASGPQHSTRVSPLRPGLRPLAAARAGRGTCTVTELDSIELGLKFRV
jgi:hypothetical protein